MITSAIIITKLSD